MRFGLGVLAGLVGGLLIGIVGSDDPVRERRPAPERSVPCVAHDAIPDPATFAALRAERGTTIALRDWVAEMGDVTVAIPGTHAGVAYYRRLKDAEVDGVLEAARRRAEHDMRERPNSRWRGLGWLSLVARFGGEAELVWIEALGAGDAWRERAVDRALAEGSRNPLAALRRSGCHPAFVSWLEDGGRCRRGGK